MNDFVDFALIRKAYDELMKEATHDLPTATQLMKKLVSIPVADVAPVVHAHRIDPLPEHRFTEENNTIIGRCSNCKSSLIDWTLYCPNCGAKMDEEN